MIKIRYNVVFGSARTVASFYVRWFQQVECFHRFLIFGWGLAVGRLPFARNFCTHVGIKFLLGASLKRQISNRLQNSLRAMAQNKKK